MELYVRLLLLGDFISSSHSSSLFCVFLYAFSQQALHAIEKALLHIQNWRKQKELLVDNLKNIIAGAVFQFFFSLLFSPYMLVYIRLNVMYIMMILCAVCALNKFLFFGNFYLILFLLLSFLQVVHL